MSDDLCPKCNHASVRHVGPLNGCAGEEVHYRDAEGLIRVENAIGRKACPCPLTPVEVALNAAERREKDIDPDYEQAVADGAVTFR